MSKMYKQITKKITEMVIEMLDKGIIPWKKPWVGGISNAPRSISTKKHYRGANSMILGCAGYSSPWWLTFGQARKLGGMVRKGEKSMPVHYWKFNQEYDCRTCGGSGLSSNGQCTACDGTGIYKSKYPQLFSFNVFNALQCEGLPEKYYETIKPEEGEGEEFDPVEECEKICDGYENAPDTYHDQSDRAYYSPSNDDIHLPNPDQFNTPSEYYSTRFHEMVHSTGHQSRLDRDSLVNSDGFGNHKYSKEELVAEMGATFLRGITGVNGDSVMDNSASYIANWKQKLQDNTDWLVWASSRAAKGVDWILGDRKQPS